MKQKLFAFIANETKATATKNLKKKSSKLHEMCPVLQITPRIIKTCMKIFTST